jgi:trehalose 6-phosphate phosphatase
MKVAEQLDICRSFFERVTQAPARALLLDYDGTLAPFTPDRIRAFPYKEIPELISQIMRHQTRVVFISGRPATELLFLSGIHPHPEIWGCHGTERLHPDGSYEVDAFPDEQRSALQLASRSLQACGLSARTETKPGGVAVHWRGLSSEERATIEKKVRSLWALPMKEYGLRILPFDGGLELRAPGRNKGHAVTAILDEIGPDAAVAFLGDDSTDEDAFGAIKGRGLAVLVRTEPRPTLADVWLRPPEELTSFLRGWLTACGVESYEAAGRATD